MFDPSFTKRSLRGQLKYRDFVNATPPLTPGIIDSIVNKGLSIVNNGFDSSISVQTHQLHGKPIFRLTDLSEELVVRKASSNIRHITRVVQSDRNTIVSELRAFLEEDISYRVYKFDISRFYESIISSHLVEYLEKDSAIARPTTFLVKTLIDSLNGKGVTGLPRGFSISATLSELYMRDFDKIVRSWPSVFYFNRFVDDIIAITSNDEDEANFISSVGDILPPGLEINNKKTSVESAQYLKKNPLVERIKFDYLGYSFLVRNPQSAGQQRVVEIDISQKKASKLKTRVAKACLDYLKNSDFDLLVERIKFLTGNHSIFDPDKSVVRMTGIFYNYRNINVLTGSGRLPELDRFLRHLLLAGKEKLSIDLDTKLSKPKKRKILKMTFSNGFYSRVIHSFSSTDIERITECWKHG